VGATVIDGTGAAPLADATVLVRDGRIVRVGKRGSVAIPRAARTVDVRGKTIIPGLWDMHGHLMQADWGPVYVAAGVTTARDMGNVLPFIIPFRETVHSGRGIGPQILLAGLIDGGGPNAFGAINATTPDEGRAVVRRYHDLGFEQVKLYSLLKPEVVAAISREAHRLGMTVTGHVPTALTLRAAIDSGMDHVAHLPVRGTANSDSVATTIAFLKARRTVIDPTASWGELLQHSTAEPVTNFQPVMHRLPPVLRQRIVRMGVATVDTATAHARLANTLGILRRLHEAGVSIVAGTDEGVPGWSVHREVELYVKAGIPPMDALRMATAIPAKAMGLDGTVGTLRPGMRADLVVLDASPLDDIANLRKVQLVMSRGRLYRSAEVWRAAGFR
jgi:imidazolonepropionase-like amidohydrolase